MNNEWVGVDLDGTLAHYEGWDGGNIGAPIPRMVARVVAWLAAGKDVRILTARVANGDPTNQKQQIREWCKLHIGTELDVTSCKDYNMVELWDDRAVGVEKNTGRVFTAFGEDE